MRRFCGSMRLPSCASVSEPQASKWMLASTAPLGRTRSVCPSDPRITCRRVILFAMSLICLLCSLLYTNFQSRVVSPIIGTEGDPLHRSVLPQRLGVDQGEHGDFGVAVSQAFEGLIEAELTVIDRLVVDEAPMKSENQPFAVPANGRADGLPIVGMSARGIVVNQIDVVDAGRYSHVEHRIHVLAIEGQVLGAKADHTDLQAGPAQHSGLHSHPCSPPVLE